MSKKLISWGTPKQVQIREKKEAATPVRPTSKRHNAKHCKFLNGPHVYGAYFWEKRRLWPVGTCKGCGRQDKVWLGWSDDRIVYPAYLTEEELQSFRL